MKREKPEPLAVPDQPNETWSKDFIADAVNREGLAIEVDFSLPALRVSRPLNRIIEWPGKPQQNGYGHQQ